MQISWYLPPTSIDGGEGGDFNNNNNHHSPSNDKVRGWDVIVRNSKWIVLDIARDGNCLFHALVYQLHRLNLLDLLICDQNPLEELHMTLRRIVVNHMEQNANIFNHFVEHEDILEITPTKYYQNMRKSEVYGGQQEICSFYQLFDVSV